MTADRDRVDPSARLARLARLAAGAEPPALDDAAARRMIDRAVELTTGDERATLAGRASDLGVAGRASGGDASRLAPAPGRRSVAWPIAAVGFAAVAAIAWLVPRGGPRAGAELVRVALPTGDQLVGTAGARFELERIAPADRRVRLREGAMVFDVAHAVPGQRFEVAAGDVVVVAKGTVFSVAIAQGAQVKVYEGAVEVVEHGRVHAVAAGQTWPDGALAGDPRELAAAAEAAVAARTGARALATATNGASTTAAAGSNVSEGTSGATTAAGASNVSAGTPSASTTSNGSNVSAGTPGATAVLGGSNVSAGTPNASPAGVRTSVTGATASSVSAGTPTVSAAPTGSNVSAGTPGASTAPAGSNVSAGTPTSSAAPTGSNGSAGTALATAAPAHPATSTGAPRSDLSTSTARTGRSGVPPELGEARADVAAGRFAAALAKATTALARPPASGAWLLVRADALRGLGRAADAADAYEAAAGALADTEQLAAAYTAAYVRFHDLRDGARALAALSAVTAPSSPFEERGLALRAQILVSLGRTAEARDAARAYLGRYPHGDLRAYMLRVQQTP